MKRQARGRAATSGGGASPKSTTEPTTFAEAFKRLNPRQRKFVSAYLQRPNATWAAKQADYSEKTAAEMGYENLRKPQIRAALRLGWAEAGMSAEEVRARTEEVARASLEDFYSFDQIQVRPPMLRPVSELLAELREEIDFEEEYARRALMSEEQAAAHRAEQLRRMDEALRLQIRLERDPNATAWAAGPPVLREVPRLDLAKARDSGAFHLLAKIKPTPAGLAVELEDRQHARDRIGQIHGLWGKNDDGPDGDTGIPDSTGREDLTTEELQRRLSSAIKKGAS